MEENQDHRSGSVQRSCTYACRNPAEVFRIEFYRFSEGKEQSDDLRKIPELKYKYRNREFWCRGYYVDTVGKNAKKIEEYIKHQLDEDRQGEQMTMGNY